MTPLFHCDPPSVADPGSELSIQVALKKKLQQDGRGIQVVGIRNAEKRKWGAIAQAKAEGMRTGFPDLVVYWPGGGIAFLEMKARTGTLGDAQHDELNKLHLAGHRCGCFRSVATAVAFLRAHGAPVAA